jgi:WD40 repeat protein
VRSVAFSPDGVRIVSGSVDKTVRVWDAQSGDSIGAPLQGHGDSVWGVAFSPDGTRIVSGSLDRTLRLWEIETGEALSVLELDSGVLTVAWHDDNVALGESRGVLQSFRVIEPDDPVN